jgi:hypothetical protein
MARFRSTTSLTARRAGILLFLGALAATVILFAAACGGSTRERPGGTPDAPDVVSNGTDPDGSAGQEAVVRVYSSPT